MGGFSAKDVAWAIEHCPDQVAPLLAVLIFFSLALGITYKIHKLVNTALLRDQKRTEEIESLKAKLAEDEKQQHKLLILITCAPCISKVNGVWLQDPSRNGGQPPEPIICQYHEAKRRVE